MAEQIPDFTSGHIETESDGERKLVFNSSKQTYWRFGNSFSVLSDLIMQGEQPQPAFQEIVANQQTTPLLRTILYGYIRQVISSRTNTDNSLKRISKSNKDPASVAEFAGQKILRVLLGNNTTGQAEVHSHPLGCLILDVNSADFDRLCSRIKFTEKPGAYYSERENPPINCPIIVINKDGRDADSYQQTICHEIQHHQNELLRQALIRTKHQQRRSYLNIQAGLDDSLFISTTKGNNLVHSYSQLTFQRAQDEILAMATNEPIPFAIQQIIDLNQPGAVSNYNYWDKFFTEKRISKLKPKTRQLLDRSRTAFIDVLEKQAGEYDRIRDFLDCLGFPTKEVDTIFQGIMMARPIQLWNRFFEMAFQEELTLFPAYADLVAEYDTLWNTLFSDHSDEFYQISDSLQTAYPHVSRFDLMKLEIEEYKKLRETQP